jgi:hypothetical protein
MTSTLVSRADATTLAGRKLVAASSVGLGRKPEKGATSPKKGRRKPPLLIANAGQCTSRSAASGTCPQLLNRDKRSIPEYHIIALIQHNRERRIVVRRGILRHLEIHFVDAHHVRGVLGRED